MKQQRAIGFEIKCVSNMIRRKLDTTFSSPEFDGLTGAQNAMMGYIMDHEETQDIFQKDIEEEFNIRRSSATVMLQGLEQRGYIRRTQIEKDARLKKIELTEKARKLQKRVRSEIDRFHEQLEKDLSKEEKEEFFRLLDKIKSNLKEA